jgi:hypothetical protein
MQSSVMGAVVCTREQQYALACSIAYTERKPRPIAAPHADRHIQIQHGCDPCDGKPFNGKGEGRAQRYELGHRMVREGMVRERFEV